MKLVDRELVPNKIGQDSQVDLGAMTMPEIPSVHLLRHEMRGEMLDVPPEDGAAHASPTTSSAPPITVDRFVDIFDSIQWEGGKPTDTSELDDSHYKGSVEVETVSGAPKTKFDASVAVYDFNENGFQAGKNYTVEAPSGSYVTVDLGQIFLKRESDLIFVPKSSVSSEDGPSLSDPLTENINLVTVQGTIPAGSPHATLSYDLLAKPPSEFSQPLKDALDELKRRINQPEGFHKGFEGGPHPIVDVDEPFNGKPLKEWFNDIPRVKLSSGTEVPGLEAVEQTPESIKRSGVFLPPELSERLAQLHQRNNLMSDEVKQEMGDVKWRYVEE